MVSFPPITAGEPVTVSATTYLAHLQCARQAVGRLEGVYGADSKSGLRGGLAHRIFARHLERGEIAENEFAQACREEIGSALNPKIGSLRMKPSEIKSLIHEVGDLYDRFKRLPADGFRSAEVLVEAEPAAGVTLKGSVDAVFDDERRGVRLVDWKSGALGEAAPQLDFYALVWALQWGSLPWRVEAVSVATGERFSEAPTEQSLSLTATAVADLVNAARRRFTDGTPPDATAGPWCRYCPLLAECSEGAAAVEVSGRAHVATTRGTAGIL